MNQQQPPKLVIKLNKYKAHPEPYGTFKVDIKSEDGNVGYCVIPGAALVKLRQAYKQLLVFGVDGARLRSEFPGVAFTAYPGAEITTYHSRTHDPNCKLAVDGVELCVWKEGVELILVDSTGNESCVWDVTASVKDILDDVLCRFNEEKEKRKEWLDKYEAAGKKPLMDLQGAPRGRKKRTDPEPQQ